MLNFYASTQWASNTRKVFNRFSNKPTNMKCNLKVLKKHTIKIPAPKLHVIPWIFLRNVNRKSWALWLDSKWQLLSSILWLTGLFIGSKLEQTIRIIIHMQYSVHTIKVKEIQNLYKTKHWRKIQLKRYSGKDPLHPRITACTLYPKKLNCTYRNKKYRLFRIEHI